ncbi:MAG: hypothetical protein GY742_00225 [Hyphomicrobiales bacterium]|nr:hypothetical protein [Hyphomicrobiales bacterium]
MITLAKTGNIGGEWLNVPTRIIFSSLNGSFWLKVEHEPDLQISLQSKIRTCLLGKFLAFS